MKLLLPVTAMILFVPYISLANAQQCFRDNIGIPEEEHSQVYTDAAKIYPECIRSANDGECGGKEKWWEPRDRVVVYDISYFQRLADFNANNIMVYDDNDGDVIKKIADSYPDWTGNKIINDGDKPEAHISYCQGKVNVCIGMKTWIWKINSTAEVNSVYLWYKGDSFKKCYDRKELCNSFSSWLLDYCKDSYSPIFGPFRESFATTTEQRCESPETTEQLCEAHGYLPQCLSSNGPGTSTSSTEPPASGKLPDFITSKVTMGSKDGKHEKYTWKINETAYVHDYIDNIGTADWEGKAKKIKVPFYLSKGTKEDSHSEWVRVSRQEIKREHLKVKDKPKHEYIKFNLAEWANDSTVLPGRTYNFVVCADRPKDENNGDGDVKEKHKSNNCSTEAVFYVDFGPARNVDLMADNLALTGGRTELQADEKYGLQVEVSNIGTEQPWNGFRTKYEIKGPGTGGVWQKIGDEHSKASSLYAGAIHFESMTGDDEVSAPMVGGDYVFRACADYEQVVPETDEGNNCSAELPVTVIAPPPPAACVILNPLASLPATGSFDLAATSIEFPDVIQQGDEMHPKAQVCGVSGTSPKTRATWAYANCDGTGFTAFDGDTDDGLSAGECVTEENKEGDDLANMPPGRYVMYFIANGETQVPESDHSNNVQAKEFVVE